ncbi:MAG: RAD52 family DNA repair protein, partial [Actinomycetota bacterium]|nr:RAD52 family DNA repair protein [Actinomycetota bacterium]
NYGKSNKGNDAVTVVYRAGYRLAIRAIDGETLATYTEYASGDAPNFPLFKLGDAHDFAMKTAESQALKRAAINLGDQFGLSLYNKGSLGPLVGGTLVMPDADPAKEGVDDDAPVIAPEDNPEQDEPTPAPVDDAAATAVAQVRHEQPNWVALVNGAKNNREMLLDLLAKANGMNAPQTVIDGIKAAGKALQERSVTV